MKWKVLDSEYIIRDKWLTVRSDKCRLTNGKILNPYYVFEYPNWVNVIAITKQKQIVLVEQYRHGIKQTVVELPCGGVEKTDKTPEAAARRELLEETGYAGSKFIELCQLSVNPANHNNITYCFVAKNVNRENVQNLDETENIRIVLKPVEEVITMLLENKFRQALHATALFHAFSAMGYLNYNHKFLKSIYSKP